MLVAMNYRNFRVLIFSWTVVFSGWFMINADPEPTTDFSTRKILVWKGEIRGIYERRSQLKIAITLNKNPPNLEWSRESFRQKILSQSWPIYQEKSGRELAVFQPSELIWESTASPVGGRGEWTAQIWGDMRAENKKLLSLVSVGSYIAQWEEQTVYLEPHAFFQKKPAPLPTTILHPVDHKEMVLVDRGVLLYGQGMDSTEASFHPDFYQPNLGNLKEISPFYIDRYEVTNREYAIYLAKTQAKPPIHWRNGQYPEGEADHPVDFLSYSEVEGYARWAGKRIPSEWEWEKAARGAGVEIYQNRDETLGYTVDPRIYPFGNDYDKTLCNTRESGLGKTQSVYDLPTTGASPYGAMGMCGNVAEWTSSWYDIYPGQPFVLRGYGKIYKVIRGGSYRDDYRISRVHHRSYGGIPNLKEDRRAGFRLVKDL